jgi:DNA-binding MarR family transcriptional regulator
VATNKPAKSSTTRNGPKEAGRFAYEGLERLLHERSRLGILSSLVAHPAGLVFNDLKFLCSLTDGNLSRQIQILEESGFVEVIKSVHENRPRTLVRMTSTGRKRFVEYLAELERVVRDAAATQTAPLMKHLRTT